MSSGNILHPKTCSTGNRVGGERDVKQAEHKSHAETTARGRGNGTLARTGTAPVPGSSTLCFSVFSKESKTNTV